MIANRRPTLFRFMESNRARCETCSSLFFQVLLYSHQGILLKALSGLHDGKPTCAVWLVEADVLDKVDLNHELKGHIVITLEVSDLNITIS
jgi:hypothetical protein